jgi:hypothetical protein
MLGSSPPSQGDTANSIPIAILGAGNVGAALARVWAACGHSIAFGVQDPVSEKVTAAIAALKGKGRAAQNEEAVQSATVVTLCVPWPAAEQAIRTYGNLTGKILIDSNESGVTGFKGVGDRDRNVPCRTGSRMDARGEGGEGFQYNRGRAFRERTVRSSSVLTASRAEMIRRPRQWPANSSNLRDSIR